MPRAGPRTVRRYRDAFKPMAVRVSQQPGRQMQTVAAALAMHRFMRSTWRKDAREAALRGRATKGPAAGPAREIARLEALEREHAIRKAERELLKKAIRFCAARRGRSSPSSTRRARRPA